MSTTVRLKKSKRPPPDKANDAATYPWVVRKPYGADAFFKEWKQAQSAVLSDLDVIHDMWAKRCIDDNVELVLAAAQTVRQSAAGSPLTVDAVIDSATGTRYRAEIFKRETL